MSSHESASKQILENKVPQTIGRTMLEHTAAAQMPASRPERAIPNEPLTHLWRVIAALSDYKLRTRGIERIPTAAVERLGEGEYSKHFKVDEAARAPLTLRTTFSGKDRPELRQVGVSYSNPLLFDRLKVNITLSADCPPLISEEVWRRGAWHMKTVDDPARQQMYIDETVRELDAEIARSGIAL